MNIQYRILVIFIFLFLADYISCQTRCTKIIGAGYGYYQGICVNANVFYHKNLDIGLGIGSHFGMQPLDNERHFSAIIEHNVHFGKINIQNIKPWIFSQQLIYWEQGSWEIWRIISPCITIGRTFALTKQIGLIFECGPAINLVVDIKNRTEYSGWMWPVLPNGRIQINYIF